MLSIIHPGVGIQTEARKNSSSSGSRQQRLISVTCFAPLSPHTHSCIHTFPSRSALCCVKEQSGRSFVSHLHLFRTNFKRFCHAATSRCRNSSEFPLMSFLYKNQRNHSLCNDFMYLYANPKWTAMSATWCSRLSPLAGSFQPPLCEAENKKGTEPF